jgi:hypothetical protein
MFMISWFRNSNPVRLASVYYSWTAWGEQSTSEPDVPVLAVFICMELF